VAYTLTRNLKLRLNSNLTADAAYNLQRLDTLAGVYLVDNQEAVNVRSKESITLRAADASVGGSGTGGTVNVSIEDQPLDAFNVYADALNLSGQLALDDQSSGATRALRLKYQSDLSGSVDTTADRTLSLDLQGADRSLILGGNLTTATGPLTLTAADASGSSVTVPASGILATRAGAETFENKTISAASNTITGLTAASLADDAGVSYDQLDLADSITNADVATGAAIAGTKIDPAFGNQIVSTSNRLRVQGATYYTDLIAAASGQAANIALYLPPSVGTDGQVLTSDGLGNISWETPAGTGTVTSVALSAPNVFSVGGSPITGAGTLALSLTNQQANNVWAGPTNGADAAPTFRALVVADIPTGVDHGGLAGLADDDHTQYHTDARALTWLGTRSTADLAEGANLYYTDERAQDAVGGMLADSSSINFTYTDATPEITAAVIPGGVDHDQLANFVANEHIDHTSVSISTAATSGLSGGGTIAASRALVVAPDLATSATPASGDLLLFADVSDTNGLKNATLGDLIAVGGYATDWTSGTTLEVTHNLGTRDVHVELYDNTTFETVLVQTVIRTTTNTIDLTSNEAPSGDGWRVLVRKN
jgi:hypothetical protein